MVGREAGRVAELINCGQMKSREGEDPSLGHPEFRVVMFLSLE